MYLQGLVRNIGISNFSIKKTQEVLSFCRIRPAVNQVYPYTGSIESTDVFADPTRSGFKLRVMQCRGRVSIWISSSLTFPDCKHA